MFEPNPKLLPGQELLAIDISQGLRDIDNKFYYLRLVQKYPEAVVRRALKQTLEVPTFKIRKSRKALFLYLLRKYAENNS